MNKCVKIIIERMKTNPEEFNKGKWPYILHSYRNIFTEEENKALKDQYRIAMLPKFEQEVMSALLQDEDQDELDFEPFGKATVQGGTITYKTKGRYPNP